MKNSIKTTIIFSVISVMSATSVMIIYSINRKKVTNTYSMHRNEETERSESSGCSYVDFIGDQVCDDEANTEECQFDLGDSHKEGRELDLTVADGILGEFRG